MERVTNAAKALEDEWTKAALQGDTKVLVSMITEHKIDYILIIYCIKLTRLSVLCDIPIHFSEEFVKRIFLQLFSILKYKFELVFNHFHILLLSS